MNRDDVLSLLEAFTPVDDEHAKQRDAIRTFVSSEPRFHHRDTPEAHLTASAWITNPQHTHAVLLHHAKLNIWVQPGGHLENDATMLAASLREATEETGLQNLTPVTEALFDLDIHPIPARQTEPAHVHMDLRFWFQTQQDTLVLNDESHALRWCDREGIKAVTDEASIRRMMQQSFA